MHTAYWRFCMHFCQACRVSDNLIALLIKDLKYLDAIQSKIKFSDGFDRVKYKHMDGYETYLQNLNIPFHWYVSKETKQLDYRDLTGPEKVKLFKNIKISSLMPNTTDQLEGRIEKMQEIWDDFWVITQNLKQDFDPCYVELFKKQVTSWFEKFLFVYQTKDVTPYMHALYAHVPEFLTLYKNLEYFTQQDMEKYNDITSKNVFRSSNHRGVSALEQIFLKKSRVQYLEQVGCARVKKIYTCSNCKTEGHTMKTCTNKCKSCGFSTFCAHLVKVIGKYESKCKQLSETPIN